MAETTQTKSNGNPVDPAAKFKRCQEIGLSHWLAIPPALILLEMFRLTFYAQITVLLALLGWVFFCYGLIGRQELADKQEPDENTPDCPK